MNSNLLTIRILVIGVSAEFRVFLLQLEEGRKEGNVRQETHGEVKMEDDGRSIKNV